MEEVFLKTKVVFQAANNRGKRFHQQRAIVRPKKRHSLKQRASGSWRVGGHVRAARGSWTGAHHTTYHAPPRHHQGARRRDNSPRR